jgi:hypothetical protein
MSNTIIKFTKIRSELITRNTKLILLLEINVDILNYIHILSNK